jgi:hypothetical protein
MGGEMSDRWLYTPNGKPAYYQQGKYLYTAQGGTCEYYEQDGWFYEMAAGKAAYFVQENWVYTAKGQATFYYG